MHRSSMGTAVAEGQTFLRPQGFLAGFTALALVPLLLAACGGTTTATSTTTVSIPSGWKTHTYGKAAIAVPSDWAVVTSYVCPEPKGPGTLFLGPSKNPGEVCPAYSFSVNSVTITPLRAGESTGSSACPTVKVNGLVVYVSPCGNTNPAGITEWTVPSLGVQAAATQAGGNFVGSGSSTVVGRVLHTLHTA